MISNTLKLKFSLFEDIHINQQGAVVLGNERSVSIESCFFHDIVTSGGGACVDLTNSVLNFSATCCLKCKNTNTADNSFANVVKFDGSLILISMISSCLCADTTVAGDSSIYACTSELNMSDTNATCNYTPLGASSLRTEARGTTKLYYLKRALDIDTAKCTTFEVRSAADFSSVVFSNTSIGQYVLISPAIFNWCVFVKQCDVFNAFQTTSAKNCYSDRYRTELASANISEFEVTIFGIDFIQCLTNVENCRKEVFLSTGTLIINKILSLFLPLFDSGPLPFIQDSYPSF